MSGLPGPTPKSAIATVFNDNPRKHANLEAAKEAQDFSLDAMKGVSPIKKGDKDLQLRRRLRNEDPRPYWPLPARGEKGLYGQLRAADYQKRDIWEEFHRIQSHPQERWPFPQRRKGEEPWDGCSSEEEEEELKGAAAVAKKKYDFTKIDTLSNQEGKSITHDALNQFMSRELQIGDKIEATKEILYPNEGLIIPVGKKGLVRKVKLDHREHMCAVEWEFVPGMYAIDSGAHYFMKQPIEVVFGFVKAPSTIQWPSAESLHKFEDVSCTWRQRHTFDPPPAPEDVQHPDAMYVRLRQGYNDKCFALESATMPNMMLTVVASAVSGVGGIRDRRRLRLEDYSEKKEGVDKHCCFKVKKISDKQFRFETCLERNVFLMLKLTSDPRVTPPFMHLNPYNVSAEFKVCTTFNIISTKKAIPKYVLNKHQVIVENSSYSMKATNANKNDRITNVFAQPVGQNMLGVTWKPNVGKVRVWCQFKAEKLDGYLSQWVVSEECTGGVAYPCATVVRTPWTDGYEELGFDLVRACVAPITKMHRFIEIKVSNFYSCGASISTWSDLPNSKNWTKVHQKLLRRKTGLSDSEDEEEDPAKQKTKLNLAMNTQASATTISSAPSNAALMPAANNPSNLGASTGTIGGTISSQATANPGASAVSLPPIEITVTGGSKPSVSQNIPATDVFD